jgi:hypothetical protein
MRFGSLFLALFVLALALPACSSDDPAPADAGPNACVKSGAICAVNFPFLCAPGYEAVASSDPRSTACGKSLGDDPRDVPCCVVEATPPDTGTKDVGASDAPASTDARGDAASDAPASTDARGDAPSDAPASTDALSDAGGG